MKKILLALSAVALLFATSCKKESVNPAVDVPEGSFLATIDNGANPQNAPRINDGMGTMTTIDANRYVIWETGDEISINGSTYTTDASGSSVIFSGGNATGSTFHAFYPATIAGTGAAGTLPSTQIIESGKVSNLPMYACSNDNQLTFHNICAALKVNVPAECDKVIITAHENICGTFNVTGDGTQANPYTANITSTGADTAITAQKNSGKFTIDEVIYIAIPAKTMNNFTVKYVDGTDVLYQTSLSAAQVEVNKVYNVKAPIPVYFTAQEAGAQVSYICGSVNLQYMTKINGVFSDWNAYTINSTITLTSVGDRVYFRAGNTGNTRLGDPGGQWHFTATKNVTVSGNIMCLLNGTNPGTTLTSQNNYAFTNLFTDNLITDASKLQLPATTLSEFCYLDMFNGCFALTSVPALPARTLAKHCYEEMFMNCTALTSVPSTLLPADTLAESCYELMFANCLNLTSAPALPATTLVKNCYYYMFCKCSNLQSAPELPATTLAEECYSGMFKNCSSLTAVTMKATNVNASDCLWNWLNNAGTSTGTHTLYVDNSMTSNTTITSSKGNFVVQAYNPPQ